MITGLFGTGGVQQSGRTREQQLLQQLVSSRPGDSHQGQQPGQHAGPQQPSAGMQSRKYLGLGLHCYELYITSMGYILHPQLVQLCMWNV